MTKSDLIKRFFSTGCLIAEISDTVGRPVGRLAPRERGAFPQPAATSGQQSQPHNQPTNVALISAIRHSL
jgi:hypothetical protein